MLRMSIFVHVPCQTARRDDMSRRLKQNALFRRTGTTGHAAVGKAAVRGVGEEIQEDAGICTIATRPFCFTEDLTM